MHFNTYREKEGLLRNSLYEPPHDKTNKMTAPSKGSDQSGHPPSLIRVFAVPTMKAWVLSYPLSAQRRVWSDWADAQADLSLRWAHTHFVGFVMSRLIYQNCSWTAKYIIRFFSIWQPSLKSQCIVYHNELSKILDCQWFQLIPNIMITDLWLNGWIPLHIVIFLFNRIPHQQKKICFILSIFNWYTLSNDNF